MVTTILEWSVRLNLCPGVLVWTMWTMRCQTFFCLEAFVLRKTIEENAWRPLWTTYPRLKNLAMNGSAIPANKCAEEDAHASRQLAVHNPVHMWWELSPLLSRVSWLERASNCFQYSVQLTNSLHYLSIWSIEKIVSLTNHSADERIYSVMWTRSCPSSVT